MKKDDQIYLKLKKQFTSVDRESKLYTFYEPDEIPANRARLEHFITSCRRNGLACLIPVLPKKNLPSGDLLSASRIMYSELAAQTGKECLNIGINIEKDIEKAIFESGEHNDIRTRVLVCREYYTESNQHIEIKLCGDPLMSLVAFDDDSKEIIDLRGYVSPEGVVKYTLPDGNWVIQEYVCAERDSVTSEPVQSCDILDFGASLKFLELFWDSVTADISAGIETVSALYMGNIGFNAPNRRNWSVNFNREFENRFGFDPAPYYPALYHNIGPKNRHIKSLLMTVRAELLRNGIIRALREFSNRKGLQLIYNVTEPKMQSCSWLCGDALADNMTEAGAVCNNAYLYGVNSIKLAASAAECSGHKTVSCELYRDYNTISEHTAMKEAINALARGANLLITHPIRAEGKEKSGDSRKIINMPGQNDFADFAARVQSIMREGVNQCEIAILYPIYYLHSSVYLFESKPNGFEYPESSTTVDYMSVMNSLSMYMGYDLTFLHPETLDRHCTVSPDGRLTLSTPAGKKDFRIIIIPGESVMSLSNLRILTEFFDNGGKIIATSKLPVYAYEFDKSMIGGEIDPFSEHPHSTPNDLELRKMITHIFGGEAMDKSILCGHCHNKNANGGEAYFLYSSQTAADGTYMTANTTLERAIKSFGLPLDVYLPSMPKLQGSGAFNNNYEEYVLLGLNQSIPGGGMISHNHRKAGDNDLLLLANTTNRAVGGKAYLRGALSSEIWDPHSGRIRRIRGEYVRYNGEIYTCLHLRLATDRATIVVSRPLESVPTDITEISELSPD